MKQRNNRGQEHPKQGPSFTICRHVKTSVIGGQEPKD